MGKFCAGLAIVLVVLLIMQPEQPITATEQQEAGNSKLLISELQNRGNTASGVSGAREFIELYNTQEVAVSLDGWKVEFLNRDYEAGDSPGLVVAEFSDEETVVIAAHSFFIISYEKYLPEADYLLTKRLSAGHLNYHDGSVRLLRPDGSVADMVGYGQPNNYLGAPAPAPGVDESIYRCFDGDVINNTGNNAADFHLSSNPLPGQGYDCPAALTEEDDGTNSSDIDVNTACEQVLISELFANPAGAAAGKQYIELYNPAPTAVNLSGCGLQTTHNNNIYWLDDIQLQPEEYRAFYDHETGIWLTISSGGTVYLLSPSEDELQAVTYPGNMPDDSSWAWFGSDDWKQTFAPTPGAANQELALRPCPEGQERNPDTNRCRNITSELDGTLADCGPGRERNPETNRCRNIETAAAGLQPCGPGRERNPETNRCRNIASTSSLVPCGPGRERNPETNRCRNIETAAAGLQPCGPGRERNPETNRCRNIVAPNDEAIAGIQDIRSQYTRPHTGWWIAVAVTVLALLYAAWEWRHDVRNWVKQARSLLLNPRQWRKISRYSKPGGLA